MPNLTDATVEECVYYPENDVPTAHAHPVYEIWLPLAGSRRVFVNDTVYLVKQGDVMLIPCGSMHKTTVMSDMYKQYRISFSEHYIQNSTLLQCFHGPLQLCISERRFKYLLSFISSLFSELQAINDAFTPEMIRLDISEILIILCRYQKKQSQRDLEILKITEKNVEDAAIYMNLHYRENITLNDIAEAVFISPSYLSRRFKEVTGFGVNEYLNRVRVREAMMLLTYTDLSVAKIAEMCGYSDPNYFGDAFKRQMGVSPLHYRKENGNKKGEDVLPPFEE